MLKEFFQKLGRNAISKCSKWLLIAVIACITWIGFIDEQVKSTGQRLYEQGQQLYKETESPSLPPAKKDSVLNKYIEKNKHYE